MAQQIKQQRALGQRKPSKANKSLLAPSLGVHTSELGESRVNLQQMHALENLWVSSPPVQAAKTVLHSQLLAGGIQFERGGEKLKEVKFGETAEDGSRKRGITKDFSRHLEEHWLPFARECIDCLLKFGLVPVTFCEVGQQDGLSGQE